jgi:nucleotide-binding universal stress UspA family protein
MGFREIMVCLDPHNLDTVQNTSGFAVQLSSSAKTRLCALIIEEQILEPLGVVDRVVSEHLIREDNEHQQAARRTQEIFRAATKQGGVQSETILKTVTRAGLPSVVAESARLYDCSIVPAPNPANELGTKVIEELILGSGRPLIVLPAEKRLKYSPEIVFVAWDGSRPAARAVHDAIPILQQAALTEIVTVTGEKQLNRIPSGDDLARHLRAHNIIARCCSIEYDEGSLGEQLMIAAQRFDAGMLVMGAYGHSRVQEIIFGGATRSVIKSPLLPVFLSN